MIWYWFCISDPLYNCTGAKICERMISLHFHSLINKYERSNYILYLERAKPSRISDSGFSNTASLGSSPTCISSFRSVLNKYLREKETCTAMREGSGAWNQLVRHKEPNGIFLCSLAACAGIERVAMCFAAYSAWPFVVLHSQRLQSFAQCALTSPSSGLLRNQWAFPRIGGLNCLWNPTAISKYAAKHLRGINEKHLPRNQHWHEEESCRTQVSHSLDTE